VGPNRLSDALRLRLCIGYWSRRLFSILAASSSLELFTQLKEDLRLKDCFNLRSCWSSSESPCSCLAPRNFPELGKGIGEGIRGFKSAMNEEEKPANDKPIIAGDHS
jgi:mttA/Hcf106 family protein